MKKTLRAWLLGSSLAVAGIAGAAMQAPSAALAQQSGLVNVDIQNVANNIAQNLKINVSQIPVSVNAPIGVAATVCNVSAAVLAQQAAGGNAACTATTTSTALEQIVQKQIQGK